MNNSSNFIFNKAAFDIEELPEGKGIRKSLPHLKYAVWLGNNALFIDHYPTDEELMEMWEAREQAQPKH